MNLSCTTVILHPEAKVLLFEHYHTLKRLFNDVLGHLEVDYMAITLLNSQNELLFLSSKPAVEHNLIEHNLWPFDASFHQDFFSQGDARLWEELYHDEWRKPLHHYKQEIHKFSMGLSIPSSFEEYRVVYSFALKSTNELIKRKLINKIQTLTSMGRFCLKNIMQSITLPDRQRPFSVRKPELKLIINNKVNHEINP